MTKFLAADTNDLTEEFQPQSAFGEYQGIAVLEDDEPEEKEGDKFGDDDDDEAEDDDFNDEGFDGDVEDDLDGDLEEDDLDDDGFGDDDF
jgi:hypothetical protein